MDNRGQGGLALIIPILVAVVAMWFVFSFVYPTVMDTWYQLMGPVEPGSSEFRYVLEIFPLAMMVAPPLGLCVYCYEVLG